MLLIPEAERELLFVGGKGGVGKTTIAAAIAVHEAGAGRRVLLVSTDPAHSLGDLFGRQVGDRECELLPGLTALEIDPDREVERYLESVRSNMRALVRPAMFSEIERQIALTRHSPGATEAALMDRMAELMSKGRTRFDRVVFDTAPTGHTLRLLVLPEIMAAWTEGLLRSRDRSDAFGRALERLGARKSGAEVPPGDELSMIDEAAPPPEDERGARIRAVLLERRRKFSAARRILLDRAVTAFLFVLVPEKLPILETAKALEALREHEVPVAGLVVNRVLPGGRETGHADDFLSSRKEQEEEYLARIDREFGDLPRVRVPLLPRDVEGVGSLHEISRHLYGG